jgi:hypothetical protein
MIVRSVRVLLGFIVAVLAAALTLVLFVYTPAELLTLPADMRGDRVGEAGLFTLAVAPLVAAFAALFALVAAVFAERRGIGAWSYYSLVGVGIAAAGFLTQHFSEAPGQATILQNYALMAFLVSGAVGGTVYWYFSGRYAGPRAERAGGASGIAQSARPAG